MAGSGYEDLLGEIFAKNIIQHIMSGKSYDRALRASILTFAAINHLTAAAAFNVTPPLKSKKGNPDHLSESRSQMTANRSATDEDLELLTQASSLFEYLSTGRISPLQQSNTTVIHKLYDKISTYEKSLTSRTAKLWLQFKELILIILTFLKAERLGDFQLQLHSLRCMLPYLATAGHNLHTKSVTLYLEKMHSLEETHPELYTTYLEHGHTVRRSDLFGEDCHWICALSKAWWESSNLLVASLVVGMSMSFREPFSCSQHTSQVPIMNKCRNWQG